MTLRQIRVFVVASIAVATVGCNAATPVGPSQPLTSTTPNSLRDFGTVVDSRGNPIAGAAVSFWPEAVEKLVSNESGRFDLPPGYIEYVFASKPGYEGAAAEWSRDVYLKLHDVIRIAAGQSARVTVGPRDSLGGPGLDYWVRSVRVFSNGDRRVGLQLVADDNGPGDYRVPQVCGDLCQPNSPATIFIEGGGERVVQILLPVGTTASRTFTLVTTAEDP